jgi:hypothetical protein
LIQGWKCACGITNGTTSVRCGGCSWPKSQAEEYLKTGESPKYILTGPDATHSPGNNNVELTYIKIADIDMPFMSMVNFMVKWAIASVPAMIIVVVFWMLVSIIFGASCAGLLGR